MQRRWWRRFRRWRRGRCCARWAGGATGRLHVANAARGAGGRADDAPTGGRGRLGRRRPVAAQSAQCASSPPAWGMRSCVCRVGISSTTAASNPGSRRTTRAPRAAPGSMSISRPPPSNCGIRRRRASPRRTAQAASRSSLIVWQAIWHTGCVPQLSYTTDAPSRYWASWR